MRKKLFLALTVLVCALLCVLGLAACDSGNGDSGNTGNNGSAHTHSYQWVDNGDGTHKQHCSKTGCDAPDKNKGSHVWGTNNKCQKCSAEKPKDETKTCNHAGLLWHVTDSENSTCEKTGYTLDIYVCKGTVNEGKGDRMCGKVFANEDAAKTDTFIGIIDEKQLESKDCFNRYRTTLPLSEHTPVTDAAVPSTCTQKGLTEGSHCSVCKTTIKKQEEADYSAHDYSDEIKFEDASLNSVRICRVCHTQEDGEIIYSFAFNDGNESYILTRMYGSDVKGKVVVPSTLNNLPVTAIGNRALYGHSTLTELHLPSGLISIGDQAFGLCGLKDAIIPASVTEIGDLVFAGCPLESITMPCFLKRAAAIIGVGGSNYSGTGLPDSLKKVTLNGGETVAENSFSYCDKITEIIIGEGVKSIKKNAFYACKALTVISIPDTLQYLDSSALDDCNNLQYGEIDGCVYLGNENNRCVVLVKVDNKEINAFHLGENIKVVCDGALAECGELETLTVDDEHPNYHANGNCLIHTASKRLLAGCSNSVIPTDGSVTVIASSAFEGREELCEVTLPDSVVEIGLNAFNGCSALASITVDGNNQFYSSSQGILYNKAKTAIVCVPLAITGTVTLPDGVTNAYSSLFSGCNSLEGISVSDANPTYATQSGILYNKEMTQFICIPMGISAAIIPDSITELPYMAFRNRVKLKEVTIPDSITELAYLTFDGCPIENATVPMTAVSSVNNPALKKIVITNGTEIYDGTFSSRTELTDITFPENLEKIGASAFYGCRSLTSITLPQKLKSIGNNAFSGCSALEKIVLSTSVKAIGDYAFSGCDVNEVYFAGTVEDWCNISGAGYLGSEAQALYINGQELVGKIILSDKVTAIGYGAFYNRDKITEVVIPDTVQSIGEYAFSGCSQLSSVSIGKGVKVIEGGSFNDCTALSAVHITDLSAWCNIELRSNPLLVGGKLYLNGQTLKGEVTLPDTVKSLSPTVLYGCNEITNLIIPDSVKTIGTMALSGCSALESLTVPFVGASLETSEEDTRYPFGYIFGWALYEGCVQVEQWISYGNRTDNVTYYVPATLKRVTVLGGNLHFSSFDDCNMLEELTVGEKVRGIDGHAIRQLDGLKTIYWNATNCIFNGQDYTFNPAINIVNADLIIGENVKQLPERAFSGWYGLESVTVPDGIVGIGQNAFCECGTLQYNEYDNGLYLGNQTNPYLVLVKVKSTDVTSMTVHDQTTVILFEAFNGCNGLQYNEYDNALYLGSESNPYKVLVKAVNTGITACTIHEQTEIIAYGAFWECRNLTRISVPDSVKAVSCFAFTDCLALQEISFGTGIKFIGEFAFAGDGALMRITYSGSKVQWHAISKGELWNNGSGLYTVECSDGEFQREI